LKRVTTIKRKEKGFILFYPIYLVYQDLFVVEFGFITFFLDGSTDSKIKPYADMLSADMLSAV